MTVECLATKLKWEITTKNESIKAYIKFIHFGKSTNIPAKCSKSIFKFLLPCLAPKEKILIIQVGQKQLLGLNNLHYPTATSLGKVKWKIVSQ